MKRMCLFLIFLFFGYNQISAQISDTVGNTAVRIDSLLFFPDPPGFSYSNNPWDLHWGPDNTLWFTVANKVCRYDTATHVVDTIYKRINASGCYAMSVATHPNFFSNPVVYVTYDTMADYYASGNRIVLYKYDYSLTGDSLYNETEILSWYHPGEHCGGRLHMGNDGYLYVTTAEYWPSTDTAGNLSGRVLRVDPNGTVPAINTSGYYDISYGHRNPQGIVQLPNGNIIISEFGAIIDELNLIQGYNNYGWPAYDGDNCIGILPDSCTSPTFTYVSPIDTAVRPPSGIEYYNHPAIPEFQGCILQAILSFGGVQGGIVASKLNVGMDDIVSDVHYFKGEYQRFRDVCVSPDGKVFVITQDRNTPRIRVIYNPLFVSVGESAANTAFTIFPNPANQSVTIQSKGIIGNWELVSIDGKRILFGSAPSTRCTIETGLAGNGTYFIRTEAGAQKLILSGR